jgi:hypothetical protein
MIKTFDWLILAAILILAGLLWLVDPFMALRPVPADAPMRADISLEGKPWQSIPLDGEEHRLLAETENGFNEIVVYPDGVAIVHADCPDQLCVHMGKITRAGEIIVCLPRQCLVELKAQGPANDQGGQVDAVSQ